MKKQENDGWQKKKSQFSIYPTTSNRLLAPKKEMWKKGFSQLLLRVRG